MNKIMAFSFAFLFTLSALAEGGVRFHEGDYHSVLKAAAGSKKNIIVDVYATWCPPCKKQKAEVFGTDDGLALTQNLVAWRADFDAPEHKALMKKWNVLSLPTVIFLRPDGSEIDRIEGYDKKADFLKDARAKASGIDSLKSLQQRFAKAKNESEKMAALVQISHRTLVRGEHEKGLAGLERVALSENDEAAQDALFFMGRYLSRVEGNHTRARHVWRELYHRFPKGKYATTAAWWYAGAVHELGHDALAFALFEKRARQFKGDASGIDLAISFVESKKASKEPAQRLFDAYGKHLAKKERDELRKRLFAIKD